MTENPGIFEPGSYPTVKLEESENIQTITISGHFSCGYENDVKTAIIKAAAKKPKEIIIVFSKLEWVCSCFIGALMYGL